MGLHFAICSIIILIVISFYYFSKEKVDNIETKIYGNLLLFTIFGLSMEVITALLFKNNIDYNSLLYTILSRITISYYSIWSLVFLYYFISICKAKKNYKTIFKIICIFFFFSIMISPFEFTTKNGLIIPAGFATLLAYSYCLLVDIILVIIFLRNRNKLPKEKFVPFYVLLVFGGIDLVIGFYYTELFLIGFVFAIIVIIMYFTIENPDVKMLENMTMLRDQADKANNAKSEFLSNMSHEIRTPLNAIVGFSESLKEDNLPEESMDKVEDIIMASNNLLEIVNGILDISKIEANKLEIIEKEYEIDELWEELIILTKARIGDKGLDFRVNIDPTIPKVLYGDNTRLKQVILNILTNAAKYTKEGFIDFTVSSVIKNDMVRLIISVEDSGIGIKEENLPRLFSKFDRLSVEKSITIEGTGLGLAITKKLVELMNGKIVVQSIYGKGSKFTISIDQKIISREVQHKKETNESNSKILDVSGAKVLIVDDNDLNIKVATTLLKKYNLDIESCTSGFDCIEKINKGNTYDIIFLDDMMPKLSGKETLAKLKTIKGFNIPVIALTANAIEGMKDEYLKCGFTDYLSKPIGKNELEKILRTYISKKNNESTNSLNTTSHSSIIQDSLSMIEPDFISEEKQSEEVVDNTDETVEEKVIEEPVFKENDKEQETIDSKEVQKDDKEDFKELFNTGSRKIVDVDLPMMKSNEETPKEDSNGYVLVVDDDEINLHVAKNTIGKYVSKIDTVKSGSEAIEKVIENKYDIIFMDDMMPEMDGASTLDNLYDIDGFDTPTILMTANEMSRELKSKINEHKFADYLSKPIDKEKLINILTKYIK